MSESRVTLSGPYIQRAVHTVLGGFEIDGQKIEGTFGPWKSHVESSDFDYSEPILSVDSESTFGLLISSEASVRLYVELVIRSEKSLSNGLMLDVIHACQIALDFSKAGFLYDHEYPKGLIFRDPYPVTEGGNGVPYEVSHRYADASITQFPHWHRQPDFGKVYSSQVEEYRNDHLEPWDDTRPFQHFSADLLAFKEFEDFYNWTDVHISLRSDSDVDLSFGNQSRGEIVTDIMQTHKDFRRVNYREVDSSSYLQRITSNYINSTYWQSFE